MTSNTVHLSWMVAQGPSDSFQYRDAQGQPRAVPIGGDNSYSSDSGMQKGMAHLLGMQSPVKEGQRPPLPLEPLTVLCPLVVTVGISFLCSPLQTSGPPDPFIYWVQ